MTSSLTRTATFTITEARYVSSKLAADLANLNARYGRPAAEKIEKFAEETALYLKAGYLNYVDFGFKSGTEWRVRLRYTAAVGGQLRDEPPGSLPHAAAVADLQFHSYLVQNSTFFALSASDRAAFEQSLPLVRTAGDEPTANGGSFSSIRQYSRNGIGVDRSVYTAF